MLVGIETDRGPWVQALIASGYTVYAVNPLQVARYRERHGTAGAKARSRRLADALYQQAFTALNASPGARAHYDRQRARGATHHQALRALANRLVGILHGCLRHRAPYDEITAWPSHESPSIQTAA